MSELTNDGKSKVVKKRAAKKKTVAKKAVVKKVVAKKAVAKKVTSKKAAARATTDTRKTLFSQRERYEMIAQMAYFRAEKRGFEPGWEQQDWLESEKLVDGMLHNV